MSESSSFVVDPQFNQFFEAAKFFYWYMPVNPYRLFLGPVTTRQFSFGRICYYLVLFSQLFLLAHYAIHIAKLMSYNGNLLKCLATLVWLIFDLNAIHFIYFSWNSTKDVVDVLHQLYKDFPMTEKSRVRVSSEMWAHNWKSKMDLHTSFFNAAITGIISMPIALSLVDYFQTNIWVNQLPFDLWYPFDAHALPVYPMVYLLEVWYLLINTYIIVAPIKILGGITMLICLQFKGAADRFRSIQFKCNRKDFLAIEDAVVFHSRALDISSKVRTIFSAPLLVIFVISSMVLCIFTFLAVNEEDAILRVQNTVNVISFLLFCCFISYFGTALIEHVSRSSFSSKLLLLMWVSSEEFVSS